MKKNNSYKTLEQLLAKHGIEESEYADDYDGNGIELNLDDYGLEELSITDHDGVIAYLLSRSKAKFLINFVLHHYEGESVRLAVWDEIGGKILSFQILAEDIYIID